MFDIQLLHQKLEEMLKWFHSFCCENGLRYYALGGTMLGAVRHHGFIPWDDDIDVGMPRYDYERLCELLSGRVINHFLLETPYSEDPNYCFAYSKLYDTSTTMIEQTKRSIKRGIFIDIFPLDGIGHSEKDGKKNYRKIEWLFKILTLRNLKVCENRSFTKNAIIRIINTIPSFLMSDKKLCQRIDKISKSRSFDNYEIVGNLVGAWGWKEVMSKQILGNPTLYEFEGIKIFGAEKYEDYLHKLYNNWRELPPIEKQITHHDYFLDLSKGFLAN